MFQQAIINYVNRPDVFAKLAEKFPQAASGIPENCKVASLEEAVYLISRNNYVQRKQAALIHTGLVELKELSNG
jgi:hypothetical protein